MNRNLLKQIWNERRSNAFLWMELFVVFVILWYIVDVVYVTLSIYNLPMGFDIENTYVLRFERMTSKAAAYQPGRTMKEDVADLHEIVNRLAHRPDVEAVSLSQNCIPYNDGANSFSFYLDTVPVRSLKRWITPEYFCFLHSKLMVSDDELSTVGSTNVDFRSFEHNFEVNAFIYDTETALQMREIFLQDQRDCVQVFLKNWVKRPWYRKAAESVVRLMAPLL